MLIRAKKIMAGPEGVARPGELLEVSETLGQALLGSGDATRADTPAPPTGKVESAEAPEPAETTKAPEAGKKAKASKVESAKAPEPAETTKAPEAGKPRER